MIVGRYLDVEDLVDAQGVAELIGPAQRNNALAYRWRFLAMPRSVVDRGQGRCKLCLRSEIERWRSERLTDSVQ